ncbi:MAG: hypothetical protein NTY14_05885 [Candidatus Omnitrophica bacterium]|nr:hypothetical protein [Candidatus Omnitrophota bacterium]
MFSQENSFLKLSENIEIKDNQIKNIESEILSINLVNSLSLKPQQAAFILEEAKNLKALYGQCYIKSLEVKQDLLVVYAKIKEQLEVGKLVWNTPLHFQWDHYTGKIDDLSALMQDAIEESVKKVESQLEDFQLQALDGFSDCIMPSYNEGFIGQSPKSSSFEYILENIKAMPESVYAAEKKRFAQQELDRIKAGYRNYNCQHYNSRGSKKDILRAAEEVRKMDKVLFELKKEELGRKLQEKMIDTPPLMNRKQRIIELLLSEQAIPILEKRANKKPF